ncbi:MAG: NAD(+) kinase [Pantoea sp. Brub]|nr:NAD(+) kinase [Pantoea sp. Brub]
MKKYFSCIGIISYLNHFDGPNLADIYTILWNWLINQGYKVIVEDCIAKQISSKIIEHNITITDIANQADLAIVIGGDGNMLSAARILSQYAIKVIGINKGHLGFLTDLNLKNLEYQLDAVLQGKYITEKRFLLELKIVSKKTTRTYYAMNELVLHSGIVAHMIEFEVYVDQKFAFSQRSDGLIIATPTGSTAYSLSAGGPIITPLLEAISLVPMFPHTLSARPLVISSNSKITLKLSSYCTNIKISCDSQIIIPIHKKDNILISRSRNLLNLIHPEKYCYFNTLTSKLGWAKKLF